MSFNTVNYLLYEDRKKELDGELLAEFNPWLTRKMFSYYDFGEFVPYINDTINIFDHIHPDKEHMFKFYEIMIPKQRKKHVKYLKRKKTTEDKEDDKPIPEFYSKRELKILDYYNE